MEIKQL